MSSPELMHETYISLSTLLFIGMGIAIFAILFPLIVLLHFVFKRHLDPEFFNDNHFSLYELSIFKTFPLLYIKTITYIRAIILPTTMRGRFSKNIINPNKHPLIYSLSLLAIIIIAYCGLVLVNTVIMAVFFYANAN